MRRKIEELRNKEDGFTLVELLAVIVILGLIVAIAIPAVGNAMDRARTGSSNAQNELAIDAAQLYIVDKGFPKGTEGTDGPTVSGDVATVPVSFLVSEGYMEEPSDTSTINGKSVEITKSAETSSNNAYKYVVK